MTQESASARLQAGRVLSPNWDYIFDMSINQGLPSSLAPLTPGTGLDMQPVDMNYNYNDMMNSGVSPFSALFHDNASNFRP